MIAATQELEEERNITSNNYDCGQPYSFCKHLRWKQNPLWKGVFDFVLNSKNLYGLHGVQTIIHYTGTKYTRYYNTPVLFFDGSFLDFVESDTFKMTTTYKAR